MAKGNSDCGVGVAYECNIGSIKFDVSHTSDLTEAHGLGRKNYYIQVYSNSWGPIDYGFVVKGPRTLTKRTLYNGATRVNKYTMIKCTNLACMKLGYKWLTVYVLYNYREGMAKV